MTVWFQILDPEEVEQRYLTAGTVITILDPPEAPAPRRSAEFEAVADGVYWLPKSDTYDVMVAFIRQAGQLLQLSFWEDG